ncbi:uncharacterized protein NPIL_393881 [Nephila pilipes]|uniref:Transcription factor Adf-1 n=1 Tax=Nephila pilipes TaxID=299642 RepID=A0A8X6QH61_NEPPI|nr:uncharacterized protein NPIL_393881 [Nephila pilipes]
MRANIPWVGEEDKILINFVKNHEALYNVKHRDYRKSHLKQHLWNNIGTTLDKSGTDCLKRWSYVRDYYIRRRGKPGAIGEAAKKRSDLLSFLDDVPSSQKATISNIVEDEISHHKITIKEEKEDDIEENTTQYEETGGMVELNFNKRNNNKEYEETEEMIELNFNKRNNNKEYEKTEGMMELSFNKRNNNKEYEETEGMIELNFNERNNNKEDRKNDDYIRNKKRRKLAHCEERLKEIPQRKPTPPQDELDEVDLYFNSMAKIVKRLPPYERAQLRMQISTLIGNAELRTLSNESRRYASSKPCSTLLNDKGKMDHVSDESSSFSEILSENDF